MTGDDRTRFCAGCGLHVHNLSAMTRDEAERLVCERAGRLCIRYEPTPTGSVRTLEYAGRRGVARSWRFWSGIGTMGALLAGAAQLVVKRPNAPAGPATLGRPMMGAMVMPTPAPSPTGLPGSADADGREAAPSVMGEIHVPPTDTKTDVSGPPAPADAGQALAATPR